MIIATVRLQYLLNFCNIDLTLLSFMLKVSLADLDDRHHRARVSPCIACIRLSINLTLDLRLQALDCIPSVLIPIDRAG